MFNETESQMLEEQDTVLVEAMKTQELNGSYKSTASYQGEIKGITVPPVTVHSTKKTAMQNN